ncbi:hypothetical protein [Streptomyces kanamyceticus]|uniref:WXG100 family type VII secretion target n=1 Tax=Streptomyces kanamyceticus TaxID=1967 RepID=UPI000ABB841E|nr:hypothetical protein [Streptomyces kanamyceticus]
MANVHLDELAVKYGGLDAITTELGIQARQLEADLADIKRAVAKVVEGWEGEAHTAYTLKPGARGHRPEGRPGRWRLPRR